MCGKLPVLMMQPKEALSCKQNMLRWLVPMSGDELEFHLLLIKDSGFCDILTVKFKANN